MSVLENIKDKIEKSKSILILTHENPDGDAIGSSLALYNALRKNEKNALVYIPIPDKTFSFLPGFDDILIGSDLPDREHFDACISLDCSDLNRLGIAQDLFNSFEDTICIDHHITNQNYADITYINAVASSTCENLMVVLASLGYTINKEVAECLYTGFITDTGGFRYNCQPETMEMVATLLETGINMAKIYRTIFDVTTFEKTKMTSRCLERLELLAEGQIAFTYVLRKDLDELKLEEADTDDVVNYGRNIDTVEVSVFAKERDDNTYKVSMRANEYVDISVIASKFGGGGHLRASGFETRMSLDQLKETLVEEIKKQLKGKEQVTKKVEEEE